MRAKRRGSEAKAKQKGREVRKGKDAQGINRIERQSRDRQEEEVSVMSSCYIPPDLTGLSPLRLHGVRGKNEETRERGSSLRGRATGRGSSRDRRREIGCK